MVVKQENSSECYVICLERSPKGTKTSQGFYAELYKFLLQLRKVFMTIPSRQYKLLTIRQPHYIW